MKATVKSIARLLTATIVVIGPAAEAHAQGGPAPRDLARVSLEDLLEIEIITANRTGERVEDTPAAVYVLTQDDISRSGIRTLPELFRLVPGVQVAQLTSSNWAVSIRGFADLYANKLLVLVDGRSIYKRSTSGVFWDVEDLVIDDIDRIEVVRGPGGSVWGANAVNGVINIVTKSAKDTQGALVRLGGGTFEHIQGTVRYGGSFANGAYRVYSQWSDRAGSRMADRTGANDAWRTLTNGLRVDWSRGADDWTVTGNLVAGQGHSLWTMLDPSPNQPLRIGQASTPHNWSVLGRWTHRGNGGASLQVQSFYTGSDRHDLVHEDEQTFDVDLQYHTRLGARHDLMLGGGSRAAQNTTEGSFTYSPAPASSTNLIVNLFAQDEVSLSRRVRATVGAKLEHDTVTGWGVQPTARVIWNAGHHQHVWAAFSRALRTPSFGDLALRVNYAFFTSGNLPILLGLRGNPQYRAEELLNAEAGYRVGLGSAASLDVAAFRGGYNGLQTNEPLAPVFEATPGPPHLFIATRFENLLRVKTTGVEVAAHVTPLPGWRVDGSYSGLRLTSRPDPTSKDWAAAAFDGNAPARQWQLHSSLWLGRRTEADASVFHVGRVRSQRVPAYTRVDARVEVKLTGRLSAIVSGKNLFDAVHAEASGEGAGVAATLVPRGADVHLVWRF